MHKLSTQTSQFAQHRTLVEILVREVSVQHCMVMGEGKSVGRHHTHSLGVATASCADALRPIELAGWRHSSHHFQAHTGPVLLCKSGATTAPSHVLTLSSMLACLHGRIGVLVLFCSSACCIAFPNLMFCSTHASHSHTRYVCSAGRHVCNGQSAHHPDRLVRDWEDPGLGLLRRCQGSPPHHLRREGAKQYRHQQLLLE